MRACLTKFLIFLGIIFISSISYPNTYVGNALLYKTAEQPSLKDSSLYLLWQDHKASPENVEIVLEHIIESEKKGEPFYVAIEQMNPFEQELSRGNAECAKIEIPQDLGNALLPRINRLKEQKLLSDTAVENVEIRKISSIAECICRAEQGFNIAATLNYGDEAVLESFTRYIGKPIEDVTYQDVLNEVFAMMEMAEQTVEMIRSDERLYESLTDKLLYTCYDRMISFIDLVIELGIDCSQSVMAKVNVPGLPSEVAGCVGIGIKNGRRFGLELHNMTSDLMDVYLLKRTMELLKSGSHKKIMIIAGAKHTHDVLRHLSTSKQFTEALSVGSEHIKIPDHKDFGLLLTSQELKKFLETPLYEAFLAKLFLEKKKLEEEEEIRRKRAVSLAMVLCQACLSAISSLKKVLIPLTGEATTPPAKKS